jgi:TolB protein
MHRARAIPIIPAILVATLVAAGTSMSATPAAGTTGPYANGRIAYTYCCGQAIIYTVRPDGGGRRSVYRAVNDDAPLTPSWAPDGTQLAFVPGAVRRGLWVMSASGRGLRRITLGRGDVLFPTWSPRGRALAFADLQNDTSGRHDIFLVGIAGKPVRRLTSSGADESHPVWAPNGGEIVYDRGRDLWRMRSDGRGQRLLIRDASAASWSPGGSHIAFLRRGDVWIARRDGSGAKLVADMPRAQLAVVWSPDSRWLLTAPVDRGDLMLTSADGRTTKPLTAQADAFHGWPTWQRLSRAH